MSETVRVFVNGRGIDAPAGATALEAVRLADARAAAGVAEGRRIITDSRGLPVDGDSPAHGGAIYRLIPVRRGNVEDDFSELT